MTIQLKMDEKTRNEVIEKAKSILDETVANLDYDDTTEDNLIKLTGCMNNEFNNSNLNFIFTRCLRDEYDLICTNLDANSMIMCEVDIHLLEQKDEDNAERKDQLAFKLRKLFDDELSYYSLSALNEHKLPVALTQDDLQECIKAMYKIIDDYAQYFFDDIYDDVHEPFPMESM